MSVVASDADQQGLLQYSIVSGDDDSQFAINPTTGECYQLVTLLAVFLFQFSWFTFWGIISITGLIKTVSCTPLC